MDNVQMPSQTAIERSDLGSFDMKLEIVVIPVSDVDRAKRFYGGLGWRLDIDMSAGDEFRVVQFTPRGSGSSVIFGKNVTAGAPGSVQGLYLIVSDIEAARNELLRRGVKVGELFHDAGGLFHHADGEGRLSGAHPQRRSYGSFAAFSDPDGNGWLFQEVTARLAGHVEATDTSFTSARELANALRRAAVAHGAHENGAGNQDTDWAGWFAEYIVREQAGQPLPV